MADLGDFGAAVRELDKGRDLDTFTFCGEKFEVAGSIPPMLMLQLGAAATGKIGETEGFAAMWESLRCSLTPEVTGDEPEDGAEFSRFYRLAVSRHVELDAIMRLTFKLFEAQSGRPTVQDSDSSPGPQSGSQSSKSSSTHPALSHLRPVSEVLTG